ncbi:MAG: hypothetical protein K8U57_40825 [Planctomycetes bacterium]|nr:hypothetical protein [Planctomycetota bacterium]
MSFIPHSAFRILQFFVFTPLVFPLVELIRHPSGFRALLESTRIASLLGNTLALAIGAVFLAVPAGIVVAALLERGEVRGRSLLRLLILLGAVIPLSVAASAWQALFGLATLPDLGGWRPWMQGLLPAIWVHAVSGVPWVAGFVMLALRSTDPRLEDDARLTGGDRAVWRTVLWPRVRLAAFAGGCWVFVQAFTEVSVTDLFMVRTFAEEVYFELVGNPAGVAAAVAVTLPVWLVAAMLAVVMLKRAAVSQVWSGGFETVTASGSRWVAFAVWLVAVAFVAVPLLGLALRTGDISLFVRVVRVHGFTLAESVLWSAVAGFIAAWLAFAICWQTRDSRRGSAFLLTLTAIAWVTPAPLVGLGLKSLIAVLVLCEDAVLGFDAAFSPVRSLLYDQPSPVPFVWAAVLRFFPVAVAVLWPAMRSIPRELLNAAELDGGRKAVWRAVAWPWLRSSFVMASAAVGLLSLGEVVSTKLVQPPGRRSFAGDLFDAMHYGADATVAAMCLLQITVMALIIGCQFRGIRG